MSHWALHLFHCLTPLHTGGEEGTGGIDRALLREVTTGFPFLASATLKGAHRAAVLPGDRGRAWAAAFGQDVEVSGGHQGCLIFTDASLFCVPIRSAVGTFAWVTCPLLLARLYRWVEVTGQTQHELAQALEAARRLSIPQSAAAGASSAGGSSERWDAALRPEDTDAYFVGDEALQAVSRPQDRQTVARLAKELARLVFGEDQFWTTFLKGRLLVLGDEDFRRVLREALSVEANIKMDDQRGVTTDGSLRYSEFLPTETVLVAATHALPPLGGGGTTEEVWELYRRFDGRPMQLGSDESKGRGMTLGHVVDLSS